MAQQCKNTDHRFDSQYPHSISQQSVTLVRGPNALFWPPSTQVAHVIYEDKTPIYLYLKTNLKNKNSHTIVCISTLMDRLSNILTCESYQGHTSSCVCEDNNKELSKLDKLILKFIWK